MMVTSSKNTEKRQWLVAAGGFFLFIFLLFLGIWISDPDKGKPTPRELARLEAEEVRKNYTARSKPAVSNSERWISKSEKELAEYKRENRQMKQDQLVLMKKLEELENKLRSGDFNKQPGAGVSPARGVLPPPPKKETVQVVQASDPTTNNAEIKKKITNNLLPPSPQNKNVNVGAGSQGGTASAIQVFDFDDESSSSKKEKKSKNVSHYLPAGSFGKIQLLSGVDAPTGGEAKANPVPVLMRLVDHGTLPNFFNSEIRDCHVTAAARGDLSSERAKVRTEKLSCVLMNGDVIEVKLDGWVNGEDGKEGFRGRVVEKAGALLARTFFAGVFSGIGDNVASQYENVSTSPLGTVSSIDPSDVGKAGLATGFSNSMEKLADYYMDRANEMYPIIEISSKRVGELVLTNGVDLKRNIIGNMGHSE